MKQKIFLKWLPEFNAFGISDSEVDKLSQNGNTPIIELSPHSLKELNPQSSLKTTVGFLMGREKGYYTIDYPYAKAIAQSGVKIRFLTYKENLRQMEGIKGLILPGGSFNSPTEFYINSVKLKDNTPGTRSYAYITSIMKAEKEKMPILGICAGAQLLGAMHGLKMLPQLTEYTKTPIEHKSKELDAHSVFVYPDSQLSAIIGEGHIRVNSRHREAMLPNDSSSEMKIVAVAPDGIPEAWENKEKNLLCIQWHPEDYAAKGDKKMQAIYNWLADEADKYQQQRLSNFCLRQSQHEI